jgi:hypothetical protein
MDLFPWGSPDPSPGGTAFEDGYLALLRNKKGQILSLPDECSSTSILA